MYHMPNSNQQMLTPLSQQSMAQQPLSNAPATPATPQQQILMGHSSHMNPDPLAVAITLILKDFRKSLQEFNESAEKCADNYFADDKKVTTTPQNPLSVNPQSVNPLSVNAPNSVNAADEKFDINENMSPMEIYNGNFNHFLNMCDDIEKNLVT